jgi:16S rRNA (cytosine967-C5)-methyltransferase
VSRYHSYINSAKEILQRYKGEEPLASFLKKYFAAHKKFGSKDRKQISHLCYCFFRLGKVVMNVSFEEKMLVALYLCSDKSNEMLLALKPEWNEKIKFTTEEKLLIINYSLLITNVFPWKEELSDGIDFEKFGNSFFVQPDLFLRLRPGKENTVKQKLQQAGIRFETLSENCLALSNASKVEQIINLDEEAVVQDYSSQRIAGFLPVRPGRSDRVWDCCAGSGGKSIMAYDINPNIELTVSDARESILINLKKRFETAGIKNYKKFVADLSQDKSEIVNLRSEIIICDVPCTGSGTWSRTPEQLYFFRENKIEEYAALQKKIVSNAIPHLQPGGAFVYITCSVFRKENEEVVDFIKQKFQMELKSMEVLKGYDKKADSMFVAVLTS